MKQFWKDLGTILLIALFIFLLLEITHQEFSFISYVAGMLVSIYLKER